MRRLVLFDIDGTLVSTHGAGSRAVRAALLEVYGETGPIDSYDFHGRTDPQIARDFAGVTFLSDNRRDLSRVRTPTLVIQSSSDVIAPQSVGEYVHAHVRGSQYTLLSAIGHCPNLSAPQETVAAIERFLCSRVA